MDKIENQEEIFSKSILPRFVPSIIIEDLLLFFGRNTIEYTRIISQRWNNVVNNIAKLPLHFLGITLTSTYVEIHESNLKRPIRFELFKLQLDWPKKPFTSELNEFKKYWIQIIGCIGTRKCCSRVIFPEEIEQLQLFRDCVIEKFTIIPDNSDQIKQILVFVDRLNMGENFNVPILDCGLWVENQNLEYKDLEWTLAKFISKN